MKESGWRYPNSDKPKKSRHAAVDFLILWIVYAVAVAVLFISVLVFSSSLERSPDLRLIIAVLMIADFFIPALFFYLNTRLYFRRRGERASLPLLIVSDIVAAAAGAVLFDLWFGDATPVFAILAPVRAVSFALSAYLCFLLYTEDGGKKTAAAALVRSALLPALFVLFGFLFRGLTSGFRFEVVVFFAAVGCMIVASLSAGAAIRKLGRPLLLIAWAVWVAFSITGGWEATGATAFLVFTQSEILSLTAGFVLVFSPAVASYFAGDKIFGSKNTVNVQTERSYG